MRKELKNKIIIILVVVLVSGCAGPTERQPEVIQPIWTKIFDRTTSLDFANQTVDGGYITISNIESLQPSTEGSYQSYAWLIKTDINGNEQWNKTFGGPRDRNVGNSVEQTSDGGYIIAGYTYTGSIYRTSDDAWLIKTDKNGNVQWNKTFGGIGPDRIYYAKQTSDEGYIAVGDTYSNYDPKYASIHPLYSLSEKGNGAWLIKTDKNGNEQWNKTFGGIYATDRGEDCARTVQQTLDGGYIIGGSKLFPTGEPPSSCPSCGFQSYAWLIKTDVDGNEQWNKTFGEENNDVSTDYVQQMPDEGYITIASQDTWIIKTDKNGNVQWNRTFGGFANSAQRTSDGGYIIAGSGAESQVRNRIIKTDSNGNIIWNKMLKGPDQTDANSIRQVYDGGYIIAGTTIFYGVEPESFNRRALLLKISLS